MGHCRGRAQALRVWERLLAWGSAHQRVLGESVKPEVLRWWQFDLSCQFFFNELLAV